MLKHPNDVERLAVDIDKLSHRVYFAPDFFWRAEKFITDAGADHTHVFRLFIIKRRKEPAVSDLMKVHIDDHRPHANHFRRDRAFSASGEDRVTNAHFW